MGIIFLLLLQTTACRAGEVERKLKVGEMVEYALKPGEVVNVFMVGEDIRKGQRVEEFVVEGWLDGDWKELARGTTVGYKRLVRFEECSPEKIRFTINGDVPV